MPKIIVLPHEDLCPEGAVLEANSGDTVLDIALKNGIGIEHACEKSCACTTCHVIIREGFDSIEESDEFELQSKWLFNGLRSSALSQAAVQSAQDQDFGVVISATGRSDAFDRETITQGESIEPSTTPNVSQCWRTGSQTGTRKSAVAR